MISGLMLLGLWLIKQRYNPNLAPSLIAVDKAFTA